MKTLLFIIITALFLFPVIIFAEGEHSHSETSSEHICGPDCDHEHEHSDITHDECGPDCDHDHEHSDVTEDHECGPDCDHEHDHEHTGNMPSLSGLDVEEEHSSDSECHANHDPYLIDSILMQPWRHPEALKGDMWLKKIAPLSALFILAILIRPVINNIIRKVGK